MAAALRLPRTRTGRRGRRGARDRRPLAPRRASRRRARGPRGESPGRRGAPRMRRRLRVPSARPRAVNAREIVVDAHGLRISGLVAEPATAPSRALVLALPGNAMLARYFDGPVDRRGSLLDLGAAQGFTVWAIDRPGYGASARAPAAQGVREAVEWPRVLESIAPAVVVPVRFTYGDHERLWPIDDDSLRELRSLFTSSPRVETFIQRGAGHNVSLSNAAAEYHA